MLITIGIISFTFFSYHTLRDWSIIRLGWASSKWPRTEAIITGSSDNSFKIDSVSRYSQATTTSYYELLLTMRYTVDGVTHYTHNYAFGGHLDQAWESLAVGDRIPVYYDPANPRLAVAKPGLTISLIFSPLLAVFSLAWIAWCTIG